MCIDSEPIDSIRIDYNEDEKIVVHGITTHSCGMTFSTLNEALKSIEDHFKHVHNYDFRREV
jgi:hypothetical protein